MDDYLAGRMVRDPLCVYDMDVPIDGADAFVVTTTERARDLPHPPVLVHAATLGHTDYGSEEQLRDLDHAGQVVVAAKLWAKSDLTPRRRRRLLPLRGLLEHRPQLVRERRLLRAGRGRRGSSAQHWDDDEQRILIDGRVPVNSHGGSLSEGGTQGAAPPAGGGPAAAGRRRRAPGGGAPQAALVTPGGFYFNSQGMILRSA